MGRQAGGTEDDKAFGFRQEAIIEFIDDCRMDIPKDPSESQHLAMHTKALFGPDLVACYGSREIDFACVVRTRAEPLLGFCF